MSKIWQCFQVSEDDPGKCICITCAKEIPRGTTPRNYNTTNLWRHIKANNGQCNVIESDETGTRQMTLEESFRKKSQYNAEHPRAKAITEGIARFIALDMQPFSVVEDTGFVKLMELLEPRYKIPSRSSFTRSIVPKLYNKVKNELIATMDDRLSKVSLTCDLWTSSNTRGYLAITGHFATKDGLHSPLLCFKNVESRHTAENIAEELRTEVENFGHIILEDIFSLTTDNATTMINATRRLNIPHKGCAAHKLNLMVDTSLKSQRFVKDAITQCRNVASCLHRSTKSAAVLRKVQEELKLPEKRVSQDVQTRWNSQLVMLRSILEQKRPLLRIAEVHNAETAGTLCEAVRAITYEKWDLLPLLVIILEPMEEATKKLSRADDSICGTIPLTKSVRNVLVNLRDDASITGVGTTHDVLISQLNERFQSIETSMEYKCATALDPRYKAILFPDEKEEIITKIKQSIIGSRPDDEDIELQEAETPPERQGRQSIDGALAEMVAGSSRPATNLHPVDAYFQEPVVSMSSDPVKYWIEKRDVYPTIYKHALSVLSCPSTSVASERVFSVSGRIVEPRRSRLTPARVEMLTFLKFNMK